MRTRQTWVHVYFTYQGSVRVRFEHLVSEPGNIKRTVGKEHIFGPTKRYRLLRLMNTIQKSQSRQYTVFAIDGFSVLFERRLDT